MKLPEAVAQEILGCYSKGADMLNSFHERLTHVQERAFHDPIKRNSFQTFKTSARTCILQKDNNSSTVAVNRDILASVLCHSAKYSQPIDWEVAFKYPLSPIPLSLSTADGKLRKTSKSKLLPKILKDARLSDPKEETVSDKSHSTFVVDLMAAIRTLSNIPETYEKLTWKLLETFPKGYNRIDIIADTYQENSIKQGERSSRGTGARTLIKSEQSKEEADTKVILHCHHAISNSEGSVILRSPSGDTDILVIAVGLIHSAEIVYIDYGNGKNRKGLWLNDITLSAQLKKALIGFHSFTGNDYASSFFRRGKSVCWNAMRKESKFIDCFSMLGEQWFVSEELMLAVEEYICFLYGYKERSVNMVRNKMFHQKYANNGKVVDLSLFCLLVNQFLSCIQKEPTLLQKSGSHR